jgi:hypothetical protein
MNEVIHDEHLLYSNRPDHPHETVNYGLDCSNTDVAYISEYMDSPNPDDIPDIYDTTYHGGYVEEASYVSNLAKNAKSKAIVYIKEYQNRLKPLYDAIKLYCEKNKELFINDLDVLLDDSTLTDDMISNNTKLTIYGNNVLKHSRNLTNDVYKAGVEAKIKCIDMLHTITKVEREEFQLIYGNTILLTLFSIGSYDNKSQYNTNFTKAITPYKRANINYIPAEIEIISIYDKLIHCDFSNLSTEEKLYNTIKLGKVGGDVTTGVSCVDKRRDMLENIKILIVKDWLVNQKDIILIGSWALNVIKLGVENLCVNYDRISMISMRNTEQILSDINKFILDELKITNITISDVMTYSVNLPKDFRLKKATYSITLPSNGTVKQKRFLDIYDTTTYDIQTAYTVDNITIGSKYVLCKYLFIEIWSYNLQRAFNSIDDKLYTTAVDTIYKNIDTIRGLETVRPTLAIGKYIELDIYRKAYVKEKKKEKKQSGDRWFIPYIPYMQLKKSDLKYF